MNVEFRKSFEKDLLKVMDAKLLERIQEVIEQVELADNLSEIRNIKKLKDDIVLLDGEPLRVAMIKEIVTAHIY